MSASLATHDPEVNEILELEMARQFRGLEMIASENFTSKAVLECLGSAFTNKYAEGEAGARYYGGSEFVDRVERLAKQRSLAAFGVSETEWGVNVQPYSGSPANMAVYVGLLRPHDRIMGLDLPSGGHLTHGFYTAKKKISATSIFFESLPYHVDEHGVIDYAELERVSEVYRPSMIVLGASAYPKDYDYARVRRLCDSLGCLLMMDMAHTAGLIAGGVLTSPFPYCDIVTTTTHKSLRGPRSGMIFFRKVGLDGKPTDFEGRINQAVFPGLQGGPHMHQIAAIATQMKEVMDPSWKAYAQAVVDNCKALAAALLSKGHVLVGGGTENHLILWNLRKYDLTGSKVEKVLDAVSISSNKNCIPGDKNALAPSGIRLGTCALTTRGFSAADMAVIAGFLDRAIAIAVKIQDSVGKKLADFVTALGQPNEDIRALRDEVEAFSVKLPMPGFDATTIKYRNGIPH
jgi:glycine hydroxymethyltransferase